MSDLSDSLKFLIRFGFAQLLHRKLRPNLQSRLQETDRKTNPSLGLSALLMSTPLIGKQISRERANADSVNLFIPASGSLAISESF